jgi:hypothetical protein
LVVDPGFVVDLGHPSTRNQPANPNQPRSWGGWDSWGLTVGRPLSGSGVRAEGFDELVG